MTTPSHEPADGHPAGGSRQLLVVAGPGRSGTSLFTGIAACVGWHIPKPEVVANRSNPRGFSEPRWAVDFHNELLKRVDVAVDDGRPEAWELTDDLARSDEVRSRLTEWLETHFAEAGHVVVKDPRVGWFLEAYRLSAADLGADLRIVTMLRHPSEVLKSRETAYGTKTNNTTRIVGWANMMLGVEARVRELPRAVLRYSDLLDDWQAAFGQARVGLDLDPVIDGAGLAEADALVDPGLHRSTGDWARLELRPTTLELAQRIYGAYDRLADAPELRPAVEAELDGLRAELDAWYDECFDVSRSRTGARARREKRQAIRRLREELAEQAAAGPSDTHGEGVLTGVRRRVRSFRRGGARP